MRGKVAVAIRWIFAIAVIAFAGIALGRQWSSIRDRLATLDVSWSLVVLASLLVLLAYAVLIETWRRTLDALAALREPLPFWSATRIWFASSLGKYIPGNVWAIAALGVMARDRGISGVAAGAASVLVNVVNLATGAAIVVLLAARLVPNPAVVSVIAIVMLGAAIAAPRLLPRVLRLASRVLRREIAIPPISNTTVWWSVAGTTIAWGLYGTAFQLFARALVGDAAQGPLPAYVAAYTGAYILGFIVPIAPAGLGVREYALVQGLTRLGLCGFAEATVVAVASRLWLTVLEVAPGFIALAWGRRHHSTFHEDIPPDGR